MHFGFYQQDRYIIWEEYYIYGTIVTTEVRTTINSREKTSAHHMSNDICIVAYERVLLQVKMFKIVAILKTPGLVV